MRLLPGTVHRGILVVHAHLVNVHMVHLIGIVCIAVEGLNTVGIIVVAPIAFPFLDHISSFFSGPETVSVGTMVILTIVFSAIEILICSSGAIVTSIIASELRDCRFGVRSG